MNFYVFSQNVQLSLLLSFIKYWKILGKICLFAKKKKMINLFGLLDFTTSDLSN